MMQRIAELESTHPGLNLLKISLDYTDSAEPTVHFEMMRSGESLGLIEMLGSEIGLPLSRDDAYEKDSQADLPTPGRLIDFLRATVVSDRRVGFIQQMPPQPRMPGTVHIFADQRLYAALDAFANQLPNRDYLSIARSEGTGIDATR
jgi:hypothetical protein